MLPESTHSSGSVRPPSTEGAVLVLSESAEEGETEAEAEAEDAPRMTQLPSVDPKSAFHLSITPSSISSSPAGSSMRRWRSSLKERSTSEGEWCDTSARGSGKDEEDDDGEESEDAGKPEAELAGERI
uniref:Uncharacterized protein n=1 Tax=Zea mays TaxID=4577 RepID=C4J2Q7_MAIZE|nr:unknown [Zea mays]